jgi:hypothetical protein
MPTESEKVRDDGQAPDPKQDGARPIHVHNHVHTGPVLPQELLTQSVRQAVKAADFERRSRRRERPRGRAGFFLAKLVRIAWEGGGLAFLGMLNVMVLSQGLIELSPFFASKISTVPGLGFMAGYTVWRNIQVGHVVALGFFAGLAFGWKLLVRDLLMRNAHADVLHEDDWNLRRARLFWRCVVGVLMTCDALLYFYGITRSNLWLSSPSYFHAFIATLVYMSFVAIYSFACLYLSDWERSE